MSLAPRDDRNLDSVGAVGIFTSVTVGADGLGCQLPRPNERDLKLAHCGNAACSSAVTTTLDSVDERRLQHVGDDGADVSA